MKTLLNKVKKKSGGKFILHTFQSIAYLFGTKNSNGPLLEGEGDGRVCMMFSTKYPNILFIQTAANNIYYCSKSLRLEENKH